MHFQIQGQIGIRGIETLKLKRTLPNIQFFGIAVYAINVKIEQGHQ